MQNFNKNDGIVDNFKRFIKAFLYQGIWFGILSGLVFYLKANLNLFLEKYFELEKFKTETPALIEKINRVSDSLSIMNPSSIGNYISTMTQATFFEAKRVSLEKTVDLISFIGNGTLSIIWVIALIYFCFKVIGYYKEKSQENDLANKVVEKLLPILEEKFK